ncbi:Rne/Rng family ribonuclease [Kiritimatiella glycovorans]|nr:Rne/Rng family ribonuclease [Kiritimatiella glycovorans]
MPREVVINVEKLETRVAVLEEGQLEDFHIERSETERLVGSIFKGKIQNLEDGLQAAFVDIGLKKNAFIHYWDMIPEDAARLERADGGGRGRGGGRRKKYKPGEMQKIHPVGSEIVVQVTKDAIGTKGPRVTANLSVPGRYLVMMPGSSLKGISRKIDDSKERARLKKILARLPLPEDVGVIVRTAGLGTRKTSFVRDVRTLLEIWTEIEKGIREHPAPCRLYQEPNLAERTVRDLLTEDIDRIYIDDRHEYEQLRQLVARFSRRAKGKVQLYEGSAPVFDYFEVEKQIENVFKKRVWLKSGGYLIFDETEALVAIDVNTGRHKGSKTQAESILEVNKEAAQEVSRQVRLRNIGGLLVVDFIDMKSKKDQQAVYRMLKEGLKKDKARTNVLPISQLGLLEMTRQRVEESVRDTTRTDCAYCEGRGKVKSPLSMSVEIQRRISAILRDKRVSHNLKVKVNPSILDRFRKEDEEDLLDLEHRFNGHLTFVSDPHLHMEDFMITREDDGEVLFRAHEG